MAKNNIYQHLSYAKDLDLEKIYKPKHYIKYTDHLAMTWYNERFDHGGKKSSVYENKDISLLFVNLDEVLRKIYNETEDVPYIPKMKLKFCVAYICNRISLLDARYQNKLCGNIMMFGNMMREFCKREKPNIDRVDANLKQISTNIVNNWTANGAILSANPATKVDKTPSPPPIKAEEASFLREVKDGLS